MNEGDLSVPIKGENGVYIVRIDRVETPAPSDNLQVFKSQLSSNRSARVNFEVFQSLQDRVEIEDKRYRVY